MQKEKVTIIVLVLVIIALLVCIIAGMPNASKVDTKLIFKSNDTIDEGGNVKVKLADVNGTELENQTVNITVTDGNGTSDYYSVVTDENGNAKAKIKNDPGKYNVTVSYDGDENYEACYETQELTIEEEVKETVSTKSYPDYNSAVGNYRKTGIGENEMAVIELESGRYVIMGGDGFYEYGGQDAQGHIIAGSYLGDGHTGIN